MTGAGAHGEEGHDLVTLLIDQVADHAIFALDPHGHVATWNAGAARIAGYTADEIVGRHVSVLYTETDRLAGRPEHDLAVAAADGVLDDEGWRTRSDGTPFWAGVATTALRGSDGRLLGFGQLARDLTERRRGEELLRQSEERFRLLVNSVADYAIFLLDVNGIVSSWNLGAERLKGYRADEIIGRHFSLFYAQDDVRNGVPDAALASALENGRWVNEGWRVGKDGSRFWASVVITALRDVNGVHRGFAKVTRDLTSRKRSEDALRGVLERERDTGERLRELDRMRSQLVSVIAHDLRAPLGVTETVLHLLRTGWDELDDGAKLEHLARISARLVTMSALVDDAFELATIQSGRLDVEHVPFDVVAAVEQAISDVVPDAAARQVIRSGASTAKAIGDHQRTVQVLSNLLSNATKYSPADAPVEVEVVDLGSAVRVCVTDHGDGIDDVDRARVFEAFTRLDRDRGQRGSGLGLYIARALAEAQRGTLSVESAPGAGATFRLELPGVGAP